MHGNSIHCREKIATKAIKTNTSIRPPIVGSTNLRAVERILKSF